MNNRYQAPGLIIALVLTMVAASRPAAAQILKADIATHIEIDPIKVTLGNQGSITTMAMNADGNLLLGVSWIEVPKPVRRPAGRDGTVPPGAGGYGPGSATLADQYVDRHKYAVKVVSPQGQLLATWPMTDGLAPKVIHAVDDGTVYVGGHGELAIFDAHGKRQKILHTDPILGMKPLTSGIAVSDQYVFIAFGMGNSLRATQEIYRFDRNLDNPKRIVDRQYGCCAHLDLDVANGELLVAENSRHRVNRFDFDGNLLGRWGKRDRTNITGFAACCNPVCFDFGPGEVLYTAESGIGRIKRYSQTGEYLGVVGYVDTTVFDRGSRLALASCYIPVEVNRDGSRVYIMDVRAYVIRVLALKSDRKEPRPIT